MARINPNRTFESEENFWFRMDPKTKRLSLNLGKLYTLMARLVGVTNRCRFVSKMWIFVNNFLYVYR